eukprot:TRINITY_DN42103_c0_g1_i1.p1 TRINITY_DN42103_c0_g1~~TRINITY_DN42103_c0_g1_i1.p1  ORF type:complete len:660 (-),score=50.50 TRINITY_DN42103_c0_g1_i1:228-2186(-)
MAMTTTSLCLSPGRQSSRPIGQSPAAGYRGIHGGQPTSLTTVVRTTKSMSDLILAPQRILGCRQEPTRILVNSCAGSLRGGSPPPRASPRIASVAGQLHETSSSAGASPAVVMQSTTGPITPRLSTRSPGVSMDQQLPARRTSVGSRCSAAGPVIWPGAVRCSSADRSPLRRPSTPTAAPSCSSSQSRSPGHVSHEFGASSTLSARARFSPGRGTACPGSAASAVLPMRVTSMTPRKLHNSSSAIAPVGPEIQGVQIPVLPARKAASMAVPVCSVSSYGRDDQVAKLRNTLMQQIHSVQREIQRVELERRSLQPRARTPQGSTPVTSDLRGCTSSQPCAEWPFNLRKAASSAVRIQRFWRRYALRQKVTPSRPSRSAARPVRFPHHAAIRIQRAWKLNRWRRLFVAYCRRDLGWVGSLDWLQRHNMLYGTELAEQEDLDWWVQQQAVAPLDYEVDPWGCKKLRDHLNKMWYGLSPEDVQQESANIRKTAAKRDSSGSRHLQTTNAVKQAGKTPRDIANGIIAAAQPDIRSSAAQQAGVSRLLLQSQLPQAVSASSSMQPVVSGCMGSRSLVVPVALPQGTVNRSTYAGPFSPRLEARKLLSASTLALHRAQTIHQGPRGTAMAPRFQTLPSQVQRGSLQCYAPDRAPGLLVK